MSLKIMKFTAPWCSACKTVGLTLQKVLAEFPDAGIEYEEIDVNEQPEVAVQHHVNSSLPVLLIGPRRVSGNVGHSQLKAYVTEALKANAVYGEEPKGTLL